MLFQPKILTVVMADHDVGKTLATLQSVQQMRYRNHEIICLVAENEVRTRQILKTEMNWLPLVTQPSTKKSALLGAAIERGRYSYVDGICFIQSGTLVDREFLYRLTEKMKQNPSVDLIMPAVVRPEGRVTVFGAESTDWWPYHVKPVIELADGQNTVEDSRYTGAVMLVRLKTCLNFRLPEADDLSLLFWSDAFIRRGVKSTSFADVTVFFDGVLFTDFSSVLVVPKGWYRDVERYVASNGSWYDKVAFTLRFRWRREGGLFARFVENLWGGTVQYRTEEIE